MGSPPLKAPRGYNGSALERPMHRFLHLFFALGLVHVLSLVAQEGLRAHQLARERHRLEGEVRAREAEVQRLKARLQAAQDPAYLEALIRGVGWVRKEERLTPFPSRPQALP